MSLTPLNLTGVTTATVGTGVWVVALIVCLAARERLTAAGHGTWVQICAAGVVLGLIGMRYTRRRARRLGL